MTGVLLWVCRSMLVPVINGSGSTIRLQSLHFRGRAREFYLTGFTRAGPAGIRMALASEGAPWVRGEDLIWHLLSTGEPKITRGPRRSRCGPGIRGAVPSWNRET